MLVKRSLKGRARTTARKFASDRSGLALIEFAYALPLLMTVGLAGTEAANLALVTLRINQMAMLAADNAARVRISIDETDVNEVMVGMRFSGTSIKFGERGRVIISTIESNGQTAGNAGYKITWQRCFGSKNVASVYGAEGAGATNGTMKNGITTTGVAATTAAAANTGTIPPTTNGALIVAEVRYTYVPLVASMFMGNRELRAVQTFPVRDRAGQALTNSTNMGTTAKRLCDAAHLTTT
jgi:Flp pilus assembly protein TadG